MKEITSRQLTNVIERDKMKKTEIGRLALRAEGNWWKAYYARQDTMEGALYLGEIHMNVVVENPELKQAFFDLMEQSVSALIKDVFGREPDWHEVTAAPEHERSGRA